MEWWQASRYVVDVELLVSRPWCVDRGTFVLGRTVVFVSPALEIGPAEAITQGVCPAGGGGDEDHAVYIRLSNFHDALGRVIPDIPHHL